MIETIIDQRGRQRAKLTYQLGYAKAYAPTHPRAINGRVFEHILIWEETHGRTLPADWVVHHLNGNKADNKPENLFAIPRRSHHAMLILAAGRKRIKDLEMKLMSLQSRKSFTLDNGH